MTTKYLYRLNRLNRRSGFTLIEVLIVVMILSILALMAAPRFASSSDDARESALCSDIQTIRSQIGLYLVQHNDRGPHLNEAGLLDRSNFKTRMTGKTDADGKLNENGAYGPYITEWPANPFADAAVADDILFGKSTTPPRNGTTGWYYSVTECIFSANSKTGGETSDP